MKEEELKKEEEGEVEKRTSGTRRTGRKRR